MIQPFYNEDCILKAEERFEPESVDLFVCDPPFGINESSFDRHYNRNESVVLDGYEEAPPDYATFTLDWMRAAKNLLKPHGSLFAIIGHTNLRHVLNAAATLDLHEVNHIIWKYNFGVNTKRKFVTSHYHTLYYSKHPIKRTFNLNARFGCQERTEDGGSRLYKDLEDVFDIRREYDPGIQKNKNKLPKALLEKIILYTSNKNDVVCDLFLGNFTTAIVGKSLGRQVCGFEKNPIAFAAGIEQINGTVEGHRLKELGNVENIVPSNQGKKLTSENISAILFRYDEMRANASSHGEAIKLLCQEFGRGFFSITNILKKRM